MKPHQWVEQFQVTKRQRRLLHVASKHPDTRLDKYKPAGCFIFQHLGMMDEGLMHIELKPHLKNS